MEARNLKAREYNTDVLSHPDHNVVDYNRNTRYNNNVRSNVFHNEPDHEARQRVVNKRENTFADKPLATKVQRASYQDSNIFGTKDTTVGTVQPAAVGPAKDTRMRQSNTFNSNVFGGGPGAGGRTRDSNTFKSGVFGESVTESSRRKKLGGESSGTSNLFGDDRPEYTPSSKNTMIEAPKELYRPERKDAEACSAKAKELYGKTADVYGYTKGKKDGALMTSGADWKNTGMQSTNKASPVKGKNNDNGMGTRDRKY